MLCKWCGMESVTTDQCSWCHRVLSATPAETKADESETPHPMEMAEPDIAPSVEVREAAPVMELETESPGAAPTGSMEEEAPVEEEVSPKAPWTIAPAPPAPPPSSAAPSAGGTPAPARPIIGVRRPAGQRPGIPAPAMPPPAASRTSSPAGAASGATGSASHAPAPAVPPTRRTVSPAAGASGRSPAPAADAAMSGSTAARPASPDLMSAEDRPAPRSRPVVPATLTGPRVAAGPSGGKPSAPLLDTAAMPLLEADESNVPALGTFTPAKSKYYVGQVVDPVSGTHYDAGTGQAISGPMGGATRHLGDGASPTATQTDLLEEMGVERSPLIGLGWYAVALGVVLFFAGLFSFVFTAHYVLPLLAAQFVGAMLMPVMRVVPWADEDADDAVLFVLLTLACGPVVGLIIYGVICMLRQDTNPAILGCFIVATLARLVVEAAVGVTGEGARFALTQLTPFAQVNHFDIRMLLINWSGLVALAGWYTASIFHKLDE